MPINPSVNNARYKVRPATLQRNGCILSQSGFLKLRLSQCVEHLEAVGAVFGDVNLPYVSLFKPSLDKLRVYNKSLDASQ